MDLFFAQRKPTDYGLLLLIYAVAYLYCIPFAVWAAKQPELARLNVAHEDCVLGLCVPSIQNVLAATRGKKYIIDDTGAGTTNSSRIKSCLVTFWSAMHFGLYFVIGLSLPNLFLETFLIGVAFEVFEYYKYECHDALDILFNTTGFLVGRAVRLAMT